MHFSKSTNTSIVNLMLAGCSPSTVKSRASGLEVLPSPGFWHCFRIANAVALCPGVQVLRFRCTHEALCDGLGDRVIGLNLAFWLVLPFPAAGTWRRLFLPHDQLVRLCLITGLVATMRLRCIAPTTRRCSMHDARGMSPVVAALHVSSR